jgi:hypothetical protein
MAEVIYKGEVYEVGKFYFTDYHQGEELVELLGLDDEGLLEVYSPSLEGPMSVVELGESTVEFGTIREVG